MVESPSINLRLEHLSHNNLKTDDVKRQNLSESDILGPNGNLSDIKNLVSFKKKLFEDSSYKYRIKIFILLMSR